MEKYTWAQFWTVVIILVVIYYGIIYLVYYLPKKKTSGNNTKNNNDSNNIGKSDNNITIFDSPFISNFDEQEETNPGNPIEQEAVQKSDMENSSDSEDIEHGFEFVEFDENDVIFDNGDLSEDDYEEAGHEELVELDEDMFEVTWESYTPGEQINLDFGIEDDN